MTIRDMMRMPIMERFELIAGADGLDNEVKKTGILDYEFTEKGMSEFAGQIWLPGEFILTSFLYAKDHEERIYEAVRRLVRKRCPGLAIRNVFHLNISQETIRYANQERFPIFIIRDHTVYFEEFIIAVNELCHHIEENRKKEQIAAEILYSQAEGKKIRELALSMNYALDHSYRVYYLSAQSDDGKKQLEFFNICGIADSLRTEGDLWIPWRQGAFFVHSVSQYRKQRLGEREYPFSKLFLNPEKFIVGLSDHQVFLQNFKTALLQSRYACCFAVMYGRKFEEYKNIGSYQLLFPIASGAWTQSFLERIMYPICEYDTEKGTDLWSTLELYESFDGDIGKTAQKLCIHANTIRYRLKKLFSFFGKDAYDKNFESELLTAVKLNRIQSLRHGDIDLPNQFLP